jgi:hypothetical protein
MISTPCSPVEQRNYIISEIEATTELARTCAEVI